MMDALQEYDDASEITYNEGYDAGIKECMTRLNTLIKNVKNLDHDVVVSECIMLYNEYKELLERNL